MSVFYLHQGGETTGPHGRGRLAEMLAAGAIDADAMACAPGSEDWMPVEVAVLPAEVPTMAWKNEPQPVWARRVMRAPMVGLALLIALIGFAALVMANWIVGVVLILLALLVDRRHYICGECGNRVEKTSVVCPSCKAYLAKRIPKKR
jgi:DNA-directed RNA polymerase subunit RPC12/RpoP